MNWVTRGFSTTVGKKFVMAITGLLLCGFLVFHLAGNLLMYVGPDVYNNYAHTLHAQGPLLALAEIGLAVLFVVHICLAISTTIENKRARKTSYATKASKIPERTLSIQNESWMFISGAIILGFLLLHLSDFAFELRPDINYEGLEPFEKAIAVLQTPLTIVGYGIGTIILGVHLGHGVASAFQSLGLTHPKYKSAIGWLGVAFAIVVALGFLSFALWGLNNLVSGT